MIDKNSYIKLKWGVFEYQGDIAYLEKARDLIVPLGMAEEEDEREEMSVR
jgi:hypothetical protein